jgi:predicted naringenin-chalcone synthase
MMNLTYNPVRQRRQSQIKTRFRYANSAHRFQRYIKLLHANRRLQPKKLVRPMLANQICCYMYIRISTIDVHTHRYISYIYIYTCVIIEFKHRIQTSCIYIEFKHHIYIYIYIEFKHHIYYINDIIYIYIYIYDV